MSENHPLVSREKMVVLWSLDFGLLLFSSICTYFKVVLLDGKIDFSTVIPWWVMLILAGSCVFFAVMEYQSEA